MSQSSASDKSDGNETDRKLDRLGANVPNEQLSASRINGADEFQVDQKQIKEEDAKSDVANEVTAQSDASLMIDENDDSDLIYDKELKGLLEDHKIITRLIMIVSMLVMTC